ncbi:MAG: histidine phosphotransferase family protein [Alphaproteobacteria bacterium]|nr:histidine phosphotransferase family protein [Alphaproteobacteria bacterium]
MNHELRMAELLCTRLCHDLTGPIGAVNNGAEFLSEEGFNMQNQAIDLIVSSAFSAVSRLQFYRLAYGNVKESGEANLSDKQKLAADFFAGSKITLDWPDTETEASGVSVSLKMSRLIFNLLIMASAVLIRGGVITVRVQQDNEGKRHLSVSAKNTHIKWEQEITDILEGRLSTDDLSPKNVQAQLTRYFVDDLGATLLHKVSEDEVVFEVVQPAPPV